jgi:hypothetical protein
MSRATKIALVVLIVAVGLGRRGRGNGLGADRMLRVVEIRADSAETQVLVVDPLESSPWITPTLS